MSEPTTLSEALARLNDALADAAAAEHLADRRVASADLRIADADARIHDADQQTAHAKSGMQASEAHMLAADAHMADADARARRADVELARARAQTKQAQSNMADAATATGEYERARHHYEQLMRHRLANPLQVIAGMARTLLDRPDLDPEVRREMIQAISDAANLLERLALYSPEHLAPEEHKLRPLPFGGDEPPSGEAPNDGSPASAGDP